MKLIYQTNYVTTFYSEEKSQIEHRWVAQSYEMTEEEFKEEQLRYLDLIKTLKPQKGLVNSVDFLFTIAPLVQDWMNQELHTQYTKMVFKKAAFVVSSDIFARISIEQIFDDYQPFEVCYFEQEEEAQRWLDS